MENTTTKDGNIRKTTYSDRLTKEMEARKTQSALAAVLEKLNPFAGAHANK